MRLPRIQRRHLVRGLIAIVMLWLLANFGYRGAIAWRVRQHESTIDWTDLGIHPSASTYTLGTGTTAVLLVHGINDTPEVWNPFAPHLAESDLVVRVMRLPGFGESTDRYGAYDRHQWTGAVVTELKTLRQQYQRVVLVGHSLGGAVSIAAARDAPELIDALILLAPAVGVADDRSPILPTRVWYSISLNLAPWITVTESPFEPDALDPQSRVMASRARFVPRNVIDELFQLIDENNSTAGQLNLPMLIVVAAEDQVIDNDAVRRFAQRVSAPVQMVEQDRSGHMIQRDYSWQTVCDQVADWIHGREQEWTNGNEPTKLLEDVRGGFTARGLE